MKHVLIMALTLFSHLGMAELANAPYKFIYLSDTFDVEQHAYEKAKIEHFASEAAEKGWIMTYSIEISRTWIRYQKTRGETMASILARTKGCDWGDPDCQRMMRNINRHPPQALADDHEGQIAVPIRRYLYRIQVDAGSHYREKTVGTTTKAVMSRDLFNLYEKIIPNTSERYSKFCLGGVCSYYDLQIED
ncbi:MAG: hypothetical protein AB7G93_21390 [Bdellovibrionales bacterium]